MKKVTLASSNGPRLTIKTTRHCHSATFQYCRSSSFRDDRILFSQCCSRAEYRIWRMPCKASVNRWAFPSRYFIRPKCSEVYLLDSKELSGTMSDPAPRPQTTGIQPIRLTAKPPARMSLNMAMGKLLL